MSDPLQTEHVSGASLAARRGQLGMTAAEAAAALMLSQRHIEALETDQVAGFYNPSFYRQAQRRYAVLLGLAPAEAPTMPAAPGAPAVSPPTPAAAARPGAATAAKRSLSMRLLALLALAAAVFAIAEGDALIALLGGASSGSAVATAPPPAPQRDAPAEPAPAAALPAPTGLPENPATVPTPDVATAPAARAAASAAMATPPATREAVASAPPPGSPTPALLLEALGPCWVFARQTSGKETELTLSAGQQLVLPGSLSYLAVGDVSELRVFVAGAPRDLAPFSRDGRVARLRATELRLLLAEAPPTPPQAGAAPSNVQVGDP